METSVDQLLDFDAAEDAAVRDIAEEPESPSRAPRAQARTEAEAAAGAAVVEKAAADEARGKGAYC